MSVSNPRVLIVSKPLTPPWNDGSKNMARDLVLHAENIQFNVMTAGGPDPFPAGVISEKIFNSAGTYQPPLGQNIKTFLRLLRPDAGIDIYHFFFAPNARTSGVLKLLLKCKKQKTLHTVASAPLDFSQAKNWLFADRTIAVSEHSKQEFNRIGISTIETVHPGIKVLSEQEIKNIPTAEWESLREGSDAVFLYPGDYEFSGGHEFLTALLPEVISYHPRIKVVFACRTKTPEAKKIEAGVKSKLGGMRQIVFLNEVQNMKGLLKVCDAVLFPAASLYKKVDIPLTLLEAMSFGKPVIASKLPALTELITSETGVLADMNNSYDWTESMLKMVAHPDWRLELGAKARRRVIDFFSARAMARSYEKIYRELLKS